MDAPISTSISSFSFFLTQFCSSGQEAEDSTYIPNKANKKGTVKRPEMQKKAKLLQEILRRNTKMQP